MAADIISELIDDFQQCLRRFRVCCVYRIRVALPTFTDKRPCHSDTDHLVNEGLGYNGEAIPGVANISGELPFYNSVLAGSRVSLIDLLGCC